MKPARLSSVMLLALTACLAGSDPQPPARRTCDGDPRASTYEPGLTRESKDGLFTARLEETSPPTPGRGENVWNLALVDAAGDPMTPDSVRLKAWMPDHGHGTNPLWNDPVESSEPGRPQFGPFNLYMSGLWEFTIHASAGATEDEATLAFCITKEDVEDPGFDGGVPVDDAGMPIVCEVTAPTSCPSPSPRYADVEPIFAERCFGCHDGSGDQWPLTSYEHVADWFAEIRGMLLACTMPPPDSGVPMSVEEREQILGWIRCGFPP